MTGIVKEEKVHGVVLLSVYNLRRVGDSYFLNTRAPVGSTLLWPVFFYDLQLRVRCDKTFVVRREPLSEHDLVAKCRYVGTNGQKEPQARWELFEITKNRLPPTFASRLMNGAQYFGHFELSILLIQLTRGC